MAVDGDGLGDVVELVVDARDPEQRVQIPLRDGTHARTRRRHGLENSQRTCVGTEARCAWKRAQGLRAHRVAFGVSAVDVESGVRLVELDVDLAELQHRHHHVVLLEHRLELLLRVAQQPELVVALAQPRLPPPVLEPTRLGRLGSQVQRFHRIVGNVQNIPA